MFKRVLLGSAMLALAVHGAAAQQKDVKIGFVTTLSGGPAAVGNDMRDGFELALDHLGRKMSGLPVQVIYEDDGLKPELGKQKTDRLIESENVNFLTGYIQSHVLLASLKSAVDSNTFLISANAGPSQIAGELCSPKDVLARDVTVDRLRAGDLLWFHHAGAYGWSISHHDFLSHPHPRRVFLTDAGF